MATRHTNYMKAKVWTPSMVSECEGPPDAVIPMAFFALSTPARRAKCIAELQKIDNDMTAREKLRVPETKEQAK